MDQKEIWRDVVEAFRDIKYGLDGVIQKGLSFIGRYVGCDRAALFVLDKNEQIYISKYIADQSKIISVEEKFSLESGNETLNTLILGKNTFALDASGLFAYHTITTDQGVTGIVRIDNTVSNVAFQDAQLQRFQDFVGKFSILIENAVRHEKNKTLADELLVVSKINKAIVKTMDLNEALEIILGNMVKHLGVDRVRLFLIDQEKNVLHGKLAVDNGGIVRSIEEYRYPIKPATNEIVDVLFSQQVDDIRQKPIIHIPIKMKDESLGVLSIDNIFSKQLLSADDEKYLLIFAAQLATAIHSIRLAKKMEETTIVDAITKLYVQKYFNQRVGEEMARAKRFRQELSLLLLDIDHFKVYNDTYGHQVGDTILAELANVIVHNTREVDFIARYEGDGIMMILPNTSREGAKSVGTRARQLVEHYGFVVPDGVLNITITIGSATFPRDTDNKEEFVRMTEEALNWGKAHGRNQVVLYSEVVS